MEKRHIKPKVHINAPVILGFTGLCVVALILSFLTGGFTNQLLFCVYRAPLTDPLTYVRFFGHVVGHASWDHFFGNITLILVIGPLLEEKYGSLDMLFMILVTALVTGLVNYIFFPNVALLGASGVVFALIVASSLTSMRERSIPLTFILVVIIYLGQEIYSAIIVQDSVSQLTHVVGGLVGASLGYFLDKHKRRIY